MGGPRSQGVRVRVRVLVAGLIRRHLGLTRAQLREGGSGIVIEMLVRRLIDGRRRSETGDRGQGGAGSAAG